MKQLITGALLIVMSHFCMAQDEESAYTYMTTLDILATHAGESKEIVNNQAFEAVKLYNKTYSVKGLQHFEESIVIMIDLSKYKHLYKREERVEVYDPVIKAYLILFAENEITITKEIWKKNGSLFVGVSGFTRGEKVQ